MLSQTAEHALRAVLYLARTGNGRPLPADRIARDLGAPANYLAKTLRVLSERGVLVGIRGPNGGYRLARDPSELSLAAVVDAFDPPWHPVVCILGDRPCDAEDPCAAHRSWSATARRAREPLRSTTVADLLNGARGTPVASDHNHAVSGAPPPPS